MVKGISVIAGVIIACFLLFCIIRQAANAQEVSALKRGGVYIVTLGGPSKSLETLLRNGGGADQIGAYNETALEAIICGQDDLDEESYKKARLLLQYGADPKRLHRGVSLVEIARSLNKQKFVRLLEQYLAKPIKSNGSDKRN